MNDADTVHLVVGASDEAGQGAGARAARSGPAGACVRPNPSGRFGGTDGWTMADDVTCPTGTGRVLWGRDGDPELISAAPQPSLIADRQ